MEWLDAPYGGGSIESGCGTGAEPRPRAAGKAGLAPDKRVTFQINEAAALPAAAGSSSLTQSCRRNRSEGPKAPATFAQSE
jgi:hypothetical protein